MATSRKPTQNSAKSARKSVGRPFSKGRSGNPGGRPKVPDDVREAARALTHDALATLAQVMRDKRSPASARVSAANSLLDRAWGRPESSADLRLAGLAGATSARVATVDTSHMTPEQVYAYVMHGGELPDVP